MRPLPSSAVLAFCKECDLPIIKGSPWKMKDFKRFGTFAVHGTCPRKGTV